MLEEGTPKNPLERFKETKWAIPIVLILTAVVTCVILLTTYYMCFSYAIVAVLAFGIPYYFGFKDMKKLAIFGLVLFIFLGLAFGVYSYYEWKGFEGESVESGDGLLVNGTMTALGDNNFQYIVYLTGGNGTELVSVSLMNQWGTVEGFNLTMEPWGSPTSEGQRFVRNTTLEKDLYFYFFATNKNGEWEHTYAGLGPINISDEDFLVNIVFSRLILVLLNIALLYFILLGLVWWTQSSRKKYERMQQERGKLGPPEPEEVEKVEKIGERARVEEKFVCSECGAEVPASAGECPQCGESFEEDKEEEMMLCSECGAEVPANARKCPKCGGSFEEEEKIRCSECGAEVNASDKKCWNCGKKLKGWIS